MSTPSTKIVALYRTWKGEEFVCPSVESIYPYMTKIVFLNTNVNWANHYGKNTVLPVIEKWKKNNDKENKLVLVNKDISAQEEQFEFGMNYINTTLSPDYTMFIDTDEVWDSNNMERALLHLVAPDSRRYTAFRCNMHTYVKSPFLRVHPPEPCKPVVFVNSKKVGGRVAGQRGCEIKDNKIMNDVVMHHFTLVRFNDNIIKEKIPLSNYADKAQAVDVGTWMSKVYSKLDGNAAPTNFHITATAAACWKSVVRVSLNQLPPVLQRRGIPIMQQFMGKSTPIAEPPSISIVIPTCKSEKDIKPLVDSVVSTITSSGQVIATCRYLSAACNRNIGLNAVKHEFVIMIDDDVTGFFEGWDRALIQPLLDDPAIVYVSARLLNSDGTMQGAMGACFDVSKPYVKVPSAPSAAVAFRLSNIRFDESYIGSGFEDTDYCRQLTKNYPHGYFVINNNCRLTHQNEMKNQTGRFWEHNKNNFIRKWGSL